MVTVYANAYWRAVADDFSGMYRLRTVTKIPRVNADDIRAYGQRAKSARSIQEEARMSLKEKRCVPCEGGMPSLDEAATSKLLGQVSGWTVAPEAGQPRLRKRFQFVDF